MSLATRVDALAAAVRDRINLLETTKQTTSPGLTSIAGLAATANKMLYASGTNVWSLADLSAFARSLLDDGSASAARSTLDVYSKAEVDTRNTNTSLLGLARVTSATTTIPSNTTFGSSAGYIPGMAVTVVGDGRPVTVTVNIPSIRHTQSYTYITLNQGSQLIQLCPAKGLGNTDPGDPVHFSVTTNPLTSGTSHTFSVGSRTPAAGTGTMVADATYPAEVRVLRV